MCQNVANCVGTTFGTDCTWDRQLCVTCSTSGGVTYIRVQTNGLPNHCYATSSVTPVSLSVDFKVIWNWETTSEIFSVADTQDEADDLICDTKAVISSKIDDGADFDSSGDTSLTTISGVALSGVVITQSLTDAEDDPLYPNSKSNKESLDTCLTHTASNGMLSYYMMSPCILDSTFGGS